MDAERFDRLARGFALGRATRRGALRAALVGGVAAALGLVGHDAAWAATPCNDEDTDGNPCTADVLDARGVCTHPNRKRGARCPDDGNPCTRDFCDGNGNCTHPPRVVGHPCPGDGNPCTKDVCDGGGQCVHPAKADRTRCEDDGNPCTKDYCEGGQCVHPPRSFGHPCSGDGDACTSDYCDGNGTCRHEVRPDGTACGGCPPCPPGKTRFADQPPGDCSCVCAATCPDDAGEQDPDTCACACPSGCGDDRVCCAGECRDPGRFADDPANCGACGIACPGETPLCCAGACLLFCRPGQGCFGADCTAHAQCCDGVCNGLGRCQQRGCGNAGGGGICRTSADCCVGAVCTGERCVAV